MISEDEYILIMKMKDIDRYNEIKKEKNNNNNKNKYGEYCEECNGYLNLSSNKKYLICSICSTPYYDILPEENKKKIYHVNEKKKIEKIINDFNYDIDKNEKLDNGDKYKICDLYLNIKRNINKINRKYTFKMNFLLSRITQIIGKSEINKYLKFTLSKVTYEKYLIQWKIITNILKLKFIPPTDIKISKYYSKKSTLK